MTTDIILAVLAVISACVLMLVLAIQMQIKGLTTKVDSVLDRLNK